MAQKKLNKKALAKAEAKERASKLEKQIGAFQSSLRRELRDLSQILRAEQVCADTQPLTDPTYTALEKGCWFKIDDLILRFDPDKVKCLPSNLIDLSCMLRLEIGIICPSELSPHEDPLIQLSVEIDMRGTTTTDQKLVHCWHFDRHLNYEDSAESAGASAAHPRYHAHFGGKAVKQFAFEHELETLGSIMLFDAPRLPHPPLDAILAIDMLLSNFNPQKWYALRERADYGSLLRVSQDRLWKPYAKSLAAHWEEIVSADRWDPFDCWPHLV